jgi:hypothetical protein
MHRNFYLLLLSECFCLKSFYNLCLCLVCAFSVLSISPSQSGAETGKGRELIQLQLYCPLSRPGRQTEDKVSQTKHELMEDAS